jgi:hypothetical protein
MLPRAARMTVKRDRPVARRLFGQRVEVAARVGGEPLVTAISGQAVRTGGRRDVVALAPVGAVNGHAHAPLEGNRELSVRQPRDALAVHQVGARGAVAIGVGQRACAAQADAGDPATLPRAKDTVKIPARSDTTTALRPLRSISIAESPPKPA